jgi:hypothetical protein
LLTGGKIAYNNGCVAAGFEIPFVSWRAIGLDGKIMETLLMIAKLLVWHDVSLLSEGPFRTLAEATSQEPWAHHAEKLYKLEVTI